MSLRARFSLLTALRWFPTGLVVPVMALVALDRGLTLAQLGAVLAVQGLVALSLELPTGGLADTVGRRPVLLASGVVGTGSYVALALAEGVTGFVLAFAAAGVFRALDSGPLNAWFVDAVHAATPPQHRDHEVTSGLARGSSVVAAAIALGAAASGGLVAWAPLGPSASLVAPCWAAAVLAGAGLVGVALLVDEPPRPGRRRWWGPGATMRTVREGVALARSSRVLTALLAVEVLWGFGMVAFETLMPVRLAELLGDRALAGSWTGPLVAAGWAASAVGAALVPHLVRRTSLVAASVGLKVAQGAMVLVMALAWGPWGLAVGFVLTYAVHSAAGAAYEALLHREVAGAHRATVLSLASMVAQPSGSLGAVLLGTLASGTSTPVAMAVGGVAIAAAAPLFLVRPARVSVEG